MLFSDFNFRTKLQTQLPAHSNGTGELKMPYTLCIDHCFRHGIRAKYLQCSGLLAPDLPDPMACMCVRNIGAKDISDIPLFVCKFALSLLNLKSSNLNDAALGAISVIGLGSQSLQIKIEKMGSANLQKHCQPMGNRRNASKAIIAQGG